MISLLALISFSQPLSPFTAFSPFCATGQRDSSEVWYPGRRHGQIQRLQLPALCRSLRLRASGWMGRESEPEQWPDSLAQRSSAHVAMQRPLWTQRDEENAGRWEKMSFFIVMAAYVLTTWQLFLKNLSHSALDILSRRGILLLDLFSLWASWIPGWWVHLFTLRSWPVAHWWPDILLRPSRGLYYVGRCLGHWSNNHCLCRVSNRGLWMWCQLITGTQNSVSFCFSMAVGKEETMYYLLNPTPKQWLPILT